MAPHPAIRTPRLVLRPLAPSDAAPLFALFADWEVIRWLSTPPWPYTLDDAKSFIDRQRDQDFAKTTFAITCESALIGGVEVRIGKPSHSQSGPGPNLRYWLGRPHWGHGYMTEAARGFLAHVFAAGMGETIYAGAFADNAASLRVLEKLGFVHDGACMLHAKPRNDTFPHVNTALTRARFETLNW